jgi:flavin-dependent dehydrogenase
MKNVDVVVVGGSLAGAACLRHLERLGVEAVAFERDAFPREKVCGGFLSPGALDLLDELELLDRVRNAGAVQIRLAAIRTLAGEVRLQLHRPGLGISRKTLDTIVGSHPDVLREKVLGIRRTTDGFRVKLDGAEIAAKAVIDAGGKLSRFTPRRSGNTFGVQFYKPGSVGDVLDFWFFRDGYGGTVSVENNRTNSCFLVNKHAVPRYLDGLDCRVTGPIAYDAPKADLIAVGDAAGMIDPFCGEGMRHALDTGRLAALAVATGLRRNWPYERMNRRYRLERLRRWAAKRALAKVIRRTLGYPRVVQRGLEWRPEWLIDQFWR